MRSCKLIIFSILAIQESHAVKSEPPTSLNSIQLTAEENSIEHQVVDQHYLKNARTLGDAVKHVSGIQSSSFGPNSGVPVIRSLQGHRVGIFENGTSLQGINAISGNVNLPFDAVFTESILIHKSNNSVRYGDQSLGGSIEIDSGLIPKKILDESHQLDIVLKKGWNDFDTKGLRLQLNNQKNLAVNLQFSNQEIKSYKIPGKSKSKICDNQVFIHGGVNSSLADLCQRDARIEKRYNPTSQQYIDQFMIENPDWADGDFSFYTDQPTSHWQGKEYINPINPEYIAQSTQYQIHHLNTDVTPNYNKNLGNSYASHDNMAVGITYFLDHGYIGFSADYKDSDYGVPGFSMENKNFQENYHDTLPVSVKTKQNIFMLDSMLNQPIQWLESIQLRASNLINQSGEYIGAKEANLYKFEQQSAELIFTHQKIKNVTGEIGLTWSTRDLQGTGRALYLPNVKTDRKAFFIQEKLSFNPFYIDAGYRKEHIQHHFKDSQFKVSRNATNTKLENRDDDLKHYFIGGGVYIGDHVQFRVKYSESERAPEINELYASHPHYSLMLQEEGNQNLNKESVKAIEFNTYLDFATTKATLSLYQMNFENYLYLTNSALSTRNRLPLKYWTQTDTKVDGFEIDISHQFLLNTWGSFTVSAFADLVKNKATKADQFRLDHDGIYLPNMPTNRYGFSLNWEKDNYQLNISNTYYAQAKYLGKNINPEVPLPAYHLLDLSFSKKVATQNADFDIFLNGSNLLNEEARPQNSPLKYIAPLPGRGFQFGITMRL